MTIHIAQTIDLLIKSIPKDDSTLMTHEEDFSCIMILLPKVIDFLQKVSSSFLMDEDLFYLLALIDCLVIFFQVLCHCSSCILIIDKY